MFDNSFALRFKSTLHKCRPNENAAEWVKVKVLRLFCDFWPLHWYLHKVFPPYCLLDFSPKIVVYWVKKPVLLLRASAWNVDKVLETERGGHTVHKYWPSSRCGMSGVIPRCIVHVEQVSISGRRVNVHCCTGRIHGLWGHDQFVFRDWNREGFTA